MNKSIKGFFLFLCFITIPIDITFAAPLVESVAISGDKLIVTGHQFLDIDGLILSNPQTGFKKPFKVVSATEDEIVGTAVDSQKITVASLMNLIIDTAKGETIYPVSFSLQNDVVTNRTIKDGEITPEKFVGVTTSNPPDQSVLAWNEPTQSFIFTSSSGLLGSSSGVTDIVLGAGITGAPNTASGSVPISVDIGATGNTSKTKIPYFNSKNKIVLDSTSSPVGAITGLSFKDGTQNFTISNDNALRIDSNAFLDLLVLGVNGNLSLKGPVTVGGFEVCLSSGNCASDSVAGVTSFKTRTGAVVPIAGDYTATLVTSTAGGSVSATTVQAAIQELDIEKLPKAGGTMTGTITTTTQNAIKIGPAGSATGEFQFLETAANGTNYVGFKSPASLATNTVWTLPAVDGTSGQVLSTNGSKVLSWTSAGAGGTGNVVGPASAKATNVATYSDATGKVLLDSGIASTNIATMAANATAQFQPILSGGSDKSQVAAPYTFPDRNCLPGEILKWDITGFTCQADLGGGMTSVPGDTSPLPLATLDSTIAIYSGEDGQTVRHSLFKLNGIQLEGPTIFAGENSTFKGLNVGCFSNMLFNSSNSYGFCQDSTGDASLGTTNKVDFNVGGTTKLSVGSTITTNSGHLVNTGNLVVDTNTFFVNSATNVVGIGTTGPVQVLEINSTTKGFLPPRMTTTQKNAITPQSTGLVVFDTDLNSLNVRNSTGWSSLGSGGSGGTGNVAGPATSILNNFAAFSDTTGKNIKDSGINSGNLPTMTSNATAQFQPILSGGINKSQIAAPYTFPDRNCLPGEILKWNTTGFTCQADLGGISAVQDPATATNTTGTSIAIFSGEGLATLTNSLWKLNGIQLEGPTAFIGENSTFKNMNVGCFSNMLFNSSDSYGFCQDSTGDANLGTTNFVNFNVGGTTKLAIGKTVTTHNQHLVNTGNLVVDTNTFFVNSAANNVGIGTTGPVQALQINSTTKGFLPPRMSTAQKNAIDPQSTGLVVFDTDLNSLNVRNSTGWTSLGSGGAGTGNVAGPASSKATNLATYSDATGKVLADSGISSANLVTMSAGSVIAGNVVVTSGDKLVVDSTINLSNIPTMPANATLANQPILGVAGQKVQVAAPYTLPSKNCSAGQILKWDDVAVGFTCQSDMGGLASVPGDTSPLPLNSLDSTIAIYSGEDGQTIKYSFWKLNGIQLEGPTAFVGENSVFKDQGVGCFSHRDFTSSNSYGFCQDKIGDASLGTTNKVDFNVGGNTKLAIGASVTTHNNHLVNNGNLVVDTNTFFVNSATNNVGIGTTNPIQAFQVDSTTKGFLPPRMTSTQKNLINPQTPGMMVFDTTMNSLSLRTTDKWVLLGSAAFATFGAPMSELSDVKLKKNIKSLDLDVFAVLDKLNPVSFEWKNQLKGLRGDGPQFGFVAQEVEKVLPNLVITNEDGNKGVNEIAMIPILMEAIKKQQKQIAELQEKGTVDGLMTNSFDGKSSKPARAAPTVREPAGTTYTLAASDCGNNVALNNASAITVSVPALTPGCKIEIVQTGTGQVTVTGAGIKVGNIFGLFKTRGQYSVVTVKSINSKLAVLIGDVN